jgi:hypothetical protein
MGGQTDHARIVYITMAAIAGAVTALSFLSWKTMSWAEIGMTLFVGTAFAVFGVPWIAADWVRMDIENLRVICGITYFGATGANVFIPLIIRKLKKQFGLEESA